MHACTFPGPSTPMPAGSLRLAPSARTKNEMNKLYVKATVSLLQLPLIVGALIFLPAGTLDYWEAWLFTAVFFACSLAITVHLAVNDPKLSSAG